MNKRLSSAFFALAIGGAVLVLIANSTRADTFGSGGSQFAIDFVTIGDPGNPVDTGTTGLHFSAYGAVAYAFRIGTYEISEDMINKANALGGLRISNETRGVNRPASNVSWNEAARFVNWLNTSQSYAPAYKFTLQPGDVDYTGNENLDFWTVSDSGYDASNLFRNSNAHYFLPSEDEWYKAAYYSGSGATYYDYATGSDTIPTPVEVGGTGAGTAIYLGAAVMPPVDITQAGGLSPYGTMGQNGNVWEWQESARIGPNDLPGEDRALRGGGWNENEFYLRSSNRIVGGPSLSDGQIGFRVASVPEPSAAVFLGIGLGLTLLFRRRRETRKPNLAQVDARGRFSVTKKLAAAFLALAHVGASLNASAATVIAVNGDSSSRGGRCVSRLLTE